VSSTDGLQTSVNRFQQQSREVVAEIDISVESLFVLSGLARSVLLVVSEPMGTIQAALALQIKEAPARKNNSRCQLCISDQT